MLLEIEIFDPESKRVQILTINKDLPACPMRHHVILFGNEFDRVEGIVLDIDHDEVIVKLERKTINAADGCFDDIIKRYVDRGWKTLIGDDHGGK